ncbi:hypothetical protein HII31_05019 [Pseudocercospora fuligena]|uniref:Uncharacterized protein n=1 Tax=Pseudocercospora fuligena TaxID=685502 RepID=A0A8H6RMR9_9PEZI|nr:hypothetical protein HII31_05019 [Pseudocercospora fuligena]
MHQLFAPRKRNNQSHADRASGLAVPRLEMDRRESATVEFDHDEDYGWVHFGDQDQLYSPQCSEASMTESPLGEKHNANSHESDKSAASHTPENIGNPHASVATQDSQGPIEGPSAGHVTKSKREDLLASIARDRADLEQKMQKSESACTQLSDHVQSLRQELDDRGSQQALTLREAELNFKKKLQAQRQELDDLKSKLQSQQEQHEQQIHAALDDVSQKIQGQTTFVLEKIKADFAAELKQLKEKISAVDQDLHSTIDQRVSTQADALELALKHDRSRV